MQKSTVSVGALLALMCLSATAHAQQDAAPPDAATIAREAKHQQETLPPTELNVERATMAICAGTPVPGGWIVTDDTWSPTTCGNPTSIIYNVRIITRYSDMGVGRTLGACAYAPTPADWVVVGTSWSPTSCGHPSSLVQNIKVIRRLQ